MSDIQNAIHSFMIKYSIPSVGITDLMQILILAFIIYEIIVFLKKTQAWTLLKGIIFLVVITILIKLLKLDVLYWIISQSFNVFIIATLIVFQPELRSALDKIGRRGLSKLIFSSRKAIDRGFSIKTIDQITQACDILSSSKTGALIAIEDEVPLNNIAQTGIILDATISKEMIVNTFEHNTPLHDGAMVIKGDRIVAATCYLPLSQNPSIDKSLGTRHRAALGISETSDCVCVVVSEETGHISIAYKGELHRKLTRIELKKLLGNLIREEDLTPVNRIQLIKGLFKHDKNSKK